MQPALGPFSGEIGAQQVTLNVLQRFCKSVGVSPWKDHASFISFIVCVVTEHRLLGKNFVLVEEDGWGYLSGTAEAALWALSLWPGSSTAGRLFSQTNCPLCPMAWVYCLHTGH